MKIVLITLYFDNYQFLADITLPNWREYCQRHGYDLVAHCGTMWDKELPIGFQKTALAYETLFQQKNDWEAAFVIDLDILITNMTRKVEEFIDADHDYFVTTGFNGLCNGSFIIKKNQASKNILEYMLTNKYNHSNEQDTLKYHLDESVLKNRIKLFPYHSFNSMMLDLYPEHGVPTRERGNWEPGDFILHLPGTTKETRLNIFQSTKMQEAIVR